MITIKPDYSKNPKCYYCGKKLAVEGSEYEETMYSVTKEYLINVMCKYIETKVFIPRCKECEKIHYRAGIPSCLFFIVAWCVIAYLFYDHGGWTDSVWMVLFGIVLTTIFSSIIGFILGYIPRIIISVFMYKGRDEGDTRKYRPINILKQSGFSFDKPHPNTVLDEQVLKKDKFVHGLDDICNKCNCIVSGDGFNMIPTSVTAKRVENLPKKSDSKKIAPGLSEIAKETNEEFAQKWEKITGIKRNEGESAWKYMMRVKPYKDKIIALQRKQQELEQKLKAAKSKSEYEADEILKNYNGRNN